MERHTRRRSLPNRTFSDTTEVSSGRDCVRSDTLSRHSTALLASCWIHSCIPVLWYMRCIARVSHLGRSYRTTVSHTMQQKSLSDGRMRELVFGRCGYAP